MKEKSSYATAIIGGADGPTSIFIAGKSNGRRSFNLQELKRRFRKWNYNRKSMHYAIKTSLQKREGSKRGDKRCIYKIYIPILPIAMGWILRKEC